jgi:hypothetical protein
VEPISQKLKENFNPISKKSRFRFTGKIDFLSQIKQMEQYKNIDQLTYLNGQLMQSSEIIKSKNCSNETINEELKSYNMTPCNQLPLKYLI